MVKVSLKDGAVREYEAGTTVADIAKSSEPAFTRPPVRES